MKRYLTGIRIAWLTSRLRLTLFGPPKDYPPPSHPVWRNPRL